MAEVLRVSTVLKLVYPNSLDFVKQEDLDRGTRLHKLTEIYINNQIMGCPEVPPKEILPVVKWFEKEQVEFEATEERVFHKLGFSGQLDILLQWRSKPYWADLKFSETITEQNQMQGCAYTYLTKRPGFFLQCPSNGKVKAIRCKPNPQLLAVFLSALNLLKFQQARLPVPRVYSPDEIETMAQEAREGMETLCQNQEPIL